MQVTNYVNIVNKSDKEATLSITGDIGYNYWADTYEDYKKNTSDAMAKELQAIKDLKADIINVELESLGGDVFHGLAIYSLLKQSGATINTYLRGANASMSTVISTVAKDVGNVYMDSTGLYLIHKPMSGAFGNANDLQESVTGLNKVQSSLEVAYLDLGVSQEVLNDLMERNGGHGEWLTFAEAKEYGFIGNEWKTDKVMNYSKEQFTNRKILTPNNLINQSKKETMQVEEKDKKSLFQEFKNWFANEKEAEDKETELENLKAENKRLEDELAEATKVEVVEEVQETEVSVEETTEEVVEETEDVVVEESMETIIENKVKEAIKSSANSVTEQRTTNKTSENTPAWKMYLNNHQNFIK